MIVQRVYAALAGEMAAWNELYQYYYPRLLSTALHYNTGEAKDLVQDTFITAFLQLHQLKEPAFFGAWIKKILVNKCIRKRPQVYSEAADPTYTEWEKQLEEAEKQKRLHTVIAGMPEVLRITLLLRYFSGRQSYNEIAEILSVPVGTVRSRLNEAKAKLANAWWKPVVNGEQIDKERNAWDQFYNQTLSGLHYDAEQRRIFLTHLQDSTEVMTPGKNIIYNGRDFFEDLVASDQACGSWLKPVGIISSGDITVIEQAHFNSPEHPDHCPPACVVIIYRKKEKAAHIHIHAADH